MKHTSIAALCGLCLLTAVHAGCTGSSGTNAAKPSAEDSASVLLEPFDAPKLVDIDAKAGWIDRPVLDSLELLRKQLETEPPLATVKEALDLKNESPIDNAKILSGLGRQPAKDADVDFDASISRHWKGEINRTNPLFMNTVEEFDLDGLTGVGLFSFDWKLVPFAAKETVVSWQTSKDHLMEKVVMRDDLTWSDGEPITAYDVEFSFKTIMNPKVKIPAVRSETEHLRWVQAYDDHTLVIFHKEALATNDWNVSFPIIPKHIYEKTVDEDPTLKTTPYHDKYENHPVVGGPYEITKRERDQYTVLTRRESYYMHKGKQVREKPYFKTVRFELLEDPNTALLAVKKGDLDVMELKPEQWQTQTLSEDFYRLNTKATAQEWTYFYFGWNNKTPFFQDRDVREAMSYAVDYDELLNKICYGLNQPCNGDFHPSSWMAAKELKPYHQDLDKAEALLDKAGWTDSDNDGIRDKVIEGKNVKFEFSIILKNDPIRIKTCELLKSNLDRIGVRCNIQPLEATVLNERMLHHQFEACMGGWGSGADPDTSGNIWKTKAERNFVEYSNAKVDKLFDEGTKEFDHDKRAKIYADIERQIYADQPCTFLFYQNAFYSLNKKLRGYYFSPRGPFHYGPGFSSIWAAAQ